MAGGPDRNRFAVDLRCSGYRSTGNYGMTHGTESRFSIWGLSGPFGRFCRLPRHGCHCLRQSSPGSLAFARFLIIHSPNRTSQRCAIGYWIPNLGSKREAETEIRQARPTPEQQCVRARRLASHLFSVVSIKRCTNRVRIAISLVNFHLTSDPSRSTSWHPALTQIR
jgi:hypothetical protein